MNQSESHEGVDIRGNWLVCALRMPLGDILRGRWSGRFDERGEIAAAGLPAPLAGLILQVVRGTGLWRRERIDVARELAAHFTDGLATGRGAEQLIAEFGNLKTAARLIRKGKRRNRSRWWRAVHFIGRSLLLTLFLAVAWYTVIAVRFYVGRPDIAHNYRTEINRARHVPEADRAWPLYREAEQKVTGSVDIERNWEDVSVGSDDWDKLAAYVGGQQEAMALVRAGAKKSHVGAYFETEGNQDFIAIRLDYAHSMRQLARLLLVEARLAATEGNGERALADIASALSMADQLHPTHATLIEQLIAAAIFNSAMATTQHILAEQPQALSETQLRDLAHEIAACGVGRMTADLTAERMCFDDVLQRIYTDDGAGDGRITPEGLELLESYAGKATIAMREILHTAPENRTIAGVVAVITPGLASLVGGRRENRELFNSYFDELIAARQGPPWQWDPAEIERIEQRFMETMRGNLTRMRYMPVALLAPSVSAAVTAFERPKQLRDAVEVAIALEMWLRRHGEWPARLDELVPGLLPEVPPDRLDGQPIRYAVRDGEPVLYSIGMDHDDDGGRSIPLDESGFVYINFDPLTPADLKRYQSPDDDGDWILWPPSE